MHKNCLHLLTSIQIKKIEPTNQPKFYRDGGGLYLRARNFSKKSTKEWVFRYTSPITQTRRKQTLGWFPDTSLEEARSYAQQSRKLIKQKIDPIEQIKKQLMEEKDAFQEQQRKNTKTVEIVFYEWKEAELKNRKEIGRHNTELSFKKDVFPLIGKKPIHKVTREDIKSVLARPLKRGANVRANELLTNLKQFFRYAEDDELITVSPIRRLTKARVGGKQQSRKRVLKKDELKLLSTKLILSSIEEQYKSAICLYLATGCRRNELLSTELSAINIADRTLNIPSDKAKNNDEHNIYLSDFALKQVEKLIVLSNSENWLFPNKSDTGHVSEGVISRNVRLRQSQQHEPGTSKWQKKHTNEFELPGGHWVLHDLRRTAATIMQQCGIMPHIVKKCLNQRTDDPIMETYQRAELIEDQKQAFIKLGEYLAEIFN